MVQTSKVVMDDSVSVAILDVVRQARDHVVLVSPYNKFWDHLRNELKLAVGRKVKVAAIFRAGEDRQDMDWLHSIGGTVYEVEKLHAKIFLNESVVLLTSMNLLEGSSKNSKEVGMFVEELEAKRELRDYVLQRLIPLGSPMEIATKSKAQASWEALKSTGPQTPHKRVIKESPPRLNGGRKPAKGSTAGRILKTLKVAVTGGTCIRCAASIAYDPDRPLCDADFKTWNRYKDPDYQEDFCHRCGREANTSYAKPLCYECWVETNR